MVGVSNSFLCTLKNSGAFECRGRNDQGQLGNDGDSDSIDFVPTSGFSSPPRRFAIANTTACAVLADTKVACWGGGLFGQNGTGVAGQNLTQPTVLNNVNGVRDVFVSVLFSCAVRNDGTVQCWGKNDVGQLGTGFATDLQGPSFVRNFGDVERVSIGQKFACALKGDRSLWCWGDNTFGQLGNTCAALQCTTPYNAPPHIASPAKVPLDNVVDVAAGGSEFTCALTSEGKVLCWGHNDFGQLGNGTVGSSTSTPTLVRWR
jgi:alpha-tubulin suppressor-like RCC1 family protein